MFWGCWSAKIVHTGVEINPRGEKKINPTSNNLKVAQFRGKPADLASLASMINLAHNDLEECSPEQFYELDQPIH